MAKKREKIIALIVAGGSGTRLGGEIPKQYIKLGGQEILSRSIAAFAGNPAISGIQVVIDKNHQTFYRQVARRFSLLPVAYGGDTRQESVFNGLKAIAKHKAEKVLIHDAARPFVSDKLINEIIGALETADATIPVLPLNDTIKLVQDKRAIKTIDKTSLACAQTPQGFAFSAIFAAHEKADKKNLTDDAAVFEYSGKNAVAVPGDERNFKITTAADLERAKNMIGKETRTGMGFDVHAFSGKENKNNYVTLCGIKIPHPLRLAGHSDADAGLHAITDALLGAVGAGDIGEHFPPSDKKWKNADSAIFLNHAAKTVEEKGGRIINIDVTIICEAPKISPHRKKMRAKIAAILGLSLERISVKATTTEKLGFTGRGEGIAAQAIATVEI